MLCVDETRGTFANLGKNTKDVLTFINSLVILVYGRPSDTEHTIIMCDQTSSIVQLQLSYLVRRSHLLVQIFQFVKRGTKVPLFLYS